MGNRKLVFIMMIIGVLHGKLAKVNGEETTAAAPCEKCCLPNPDKYVSCFKSCVVECSGSTTNGEVTTTAQPTTTVEVTTTEEPKVARIVHNATIYDSDGNSYVETVEDMCMFAHNYLRQQHGVSNLTWDSTLASESAQYAKYLAEQNLFEHSPGSKDGDFGENLATSSNTYGVVGIPSHATYNWYEESWIPNNSDIEKDYDYNFNPTDSATFHAANIGHFTAVVWKETTHVGCGVATIEDESFTRTYVVARYLPPGNTLGQFPDNVLPLTNGAPSLKGNLTVSHLIPGTPGCKDVLLPSQCSVYSNAGFCNFVVNNCNCECIP